MKLVVANHSSYPRVGEGGKAQRVRRAYAKRERGEIDDAGYLDVVRDYIAEIVAEQEAAGLDLVTDGQVGWYDAVSHPAGKLEGVKITGLLRFFDTNYLVRQPEVVGKVNGKFGLAEDFRYLAGITKAKPKAVATGPYTMARHSILTGNGDLTSLTMSYAEALATDVAELAEAGTDIVQIEEPSLLTFPEDVLIVRTALERVVKDKGDIRVSLVTYFGNAASLYGELLRMPVEMLGFDLTYGTGLADLLVAQPPDRPVALGAIDGRNTKLDDIATVATTVSRVVDALDARGIDEVHLQSSCGLEYLPRDRALRKLERMRAIADEVLKVKA